MRIEQINKENPFQEECNTGHFFVGGGRGAILSDIKTALQNQVDLVTLIGEEGSGKTMLCKMLKEQWETRHRIIFLPRFVESFEDVVRVAAQECDLQYPADTNRADAKKIFLNLVAALRAKGESLLLVCDEAEKMYLATLERIRKILDDVKADGGGLQLLLAGRKSLTGNLEQLVLCNFEKISEKQFFLSALDDNETWSYLNFCVQGLRGEDQQEVFTREAAAKIASMGRGNLRLINIYAEESLQSSSADTSFLVLLDHVKDDGSGVDLLSSSSGFLSQLLRYPKYLIGCGVVAILVLLIFLFTGGDEKKSSEFTPDKQSDPVIAASSSEVVSTRESSDAEQKPEKKVSEPVVSKKKIETIITEPVAREQDTVHLQKIELVGVVPPVSGQSQDLEQGSVSVAVVSEEKIEVPVSAALETEEEAVHIQDVEPVAVVAPVLDEPQVPVHRTPVEISPVEIVEKSVPYVPEVTVPEPDVENKITVDKRKRLTSTRIESNQKKKIYEEPVASPEATAVSSQLLKDPVLARFFIEGEKWLAGDFDSSFSIQLMALKSDLAEENLRQIVSQPDYQAIADKLVILEKPSEPPVFLVFYGIYSSMSAARNARNNMPLFLRDRHPYPISVRGAVEKARVE